jgi:UDP-N-acetylglucosamine/UDP-N-acetylgalactosamine diphosphorylase
MDGRQQERITRLTQKGVIIPSPDTVFVADDVDINRISGEGVTIHSGCRIQGASTLVCRGAVLGEEAPATVKNCQIGPGVRLKGGYFDNAVFLKNAAMGSGAHVREGTILEEEASGAHTVGFKQTILLPFVTVGSLINFCDCLMAGGTGKKNHSEVGSSYIHFNFTPNQDKATASLIGDVPLGVMLNQNPIFLGGQGGLVGPTRLAYGTVIAAGCIYRKDELRPDRLLASGEGRPVNIPHTGMIYRSVKRVVQNNITYIANLLALRQWYAHVRPEFVSGDFPEALLDGLLEKVEMGISERIDRLGAFSQKLSESARNYRELFKEKASEKLLLQKMELREKWPEIRDDMYSRGWEKDLEKSRDVFLSIIKKGIRASGKNYLEVIQGLQDDERDHGSRWLQGIVDTVCRRSYKVLPSYRLYEWYCQKRTESTL